MKYLPSLDNKWTLVEYQLAGRLALLGWEERGSVLGQRIRELRQRQGLTLAELARRTGLTASLLSQGERDLAVPSVSSLRKIAEALGVPMAELFFESNEADCVVRKDARKRFTLPETNVTYELLSPNLQGKLEVILFKLGVGECSADKSLAHAGEECAFVAAGTVEVYYGENRYVLNEGDSIYLDSRVPHRIVNVGDKEAITISAITPPSF